MAYKKHNSESILLYTFGTYDSKFYGDFYYDSYRDGNKMYYREKVVLTLEPPANGSCYYNNKIKVQFKANNETINTKDIKGTTTPAFTKKTTWTSESDWYPVEKTTGTIPASIKVYDAVNSSWLNYTYSMNLPVIASVSSFGTISNFTLENTFAIPITKYSSSFTDTLTIKYGNTTIKTIGGYVNNASITLNSSELLTAYKAMGSSNAGLFTLVLETKNGNTSVGSTKKEVTGTAAGTLKTKVNGAWKNAVPLIKVNGKWEKAIAFIKVNGVWKRGNP